MGGVPGERAKNIIGRAASVLCVFRLRKGNARRGDCQDRIRWSAK
jgi:hypothetical protein